MTFKTEQEKFWAGDFGNDYIGRNKSEEYLASNLNFFSKCFSQIEKPSSLIEFGANIGMNLKAIKLLFPSINLFGIEINQQAATELTSVIGENNVYNGSILDYETKSKFNVSLIKGVLIHINPDILPEVYEKLYQSSSKYILICEYYNPSPVTITYRGHNDRLFKRDFAGEMLDKYTDLKLVDYGFCYKRDQAFPQDDITWFLLEKQQSQFTY
ncbi:pseudaminic acid biosynthesis-associated methylase [Hymenobacter tibetensis]|uniref:Pseudaminic acid biosynthesis-associated methylase n=1 Tax=Hymenobacter tibetensis TaxID=497967 RepID=A0ABY4D2X6_9BACT|nr:pseudaminic acid biosynthesis-associated methylase [Hymenobacter tibetensis]UOG76753.1 pseudaminic acid biosynthesis-associated methylase [Hymenobacter tibetensis]